MSSGRQATQSSIEGETFPFYPAAWHRKSPFFEATLRYGLSSFDIYNHMLTPRAFEGADDEDDYWRLVRGVTLWDVAAERQVEITGPDAFEFTNRLTCRDLTKCSVGQCKYAPITSEEGGIVNDPILLRLGEKHFWLSLADGDALLWVKGVAVNSGLKVEVREPDVSPAQVQGPLSKDVMRDLFGDWVLDLKYYWCRETELDDIPVVVSRTGWSAVPGYEIYLRDGSRGDELWERVMTAGQPFDIRPIVPNEARRIEAGIFNYGSDIRLENNPFEVTGLERLVESGGGDYIGKEALERIRKEGVSRKLVGVEFDGPPRPGWTDSWSVYESSGERVGLLTDAVWSPGLKRNIGYVWVPIALANVGTTLSIDAPGGRQAATVASLPFVDPKKQIPAA